MENYKAVSLFSGCGGFCEGARLERFDVVGAVENDRFAAETYRHNFSEVPLFEGDIADFLRPAADAWRAEHDRFDHLRADGAVDLVFGGPPCQGYSQIGTRLLDDPRNSLYLEYIRIIKRLKPRVILMENVPNMLLLAKGRFKTEVLDALAHAGYRNAAVRVVAATDHGVPQVRRRAIFFGVRDGIGFDFGADEWMGKILDAERVDAGSVWDAIRDLPEEVSPTYDPLPYPRCRAKSNLLDEFRLDRTGRFYSAEDKLHASGSRQLHNHHTKEIQERRRELIPLLKPGMKADSLPPEVWNGSRPEKWRRFDPTAPAHTLLAQMHRDLSEWIHPKFDRWITVREAARLQSFHDGFVFKSSEWQMLKQIGNAVPPLLARALCAVAREALEHLDGS